MIRFSSLAMLYAVAALLLSSALVSQAASETAFLDAIKTFEQARKGEDRQIEPAIAAFEALARNEPRQPAYAAYLGSALTLKAREAWMPWNKMKYSERGLDHIDQALATLKPEHDSQMLRGVPVSLDTKLVAAATFIALPDNFFHRLSAGRKLLDQVLKHPALAAAPAEYRAEVQKLAAQASNGSGQ
jgi:hypothetical protein